MLEPSIPATIRTTSAVCIVSSNCKLLKSRHRHLRGCRQQFACVSVLRLGSDLLRGSDLDDLAPIHHRDACREVAHDRHGVRDEQIGEAEIALELLKKIHDLRGDTDIESRNRFIGDNELRPQGESAGDADALALATGELVRVAARGRFIHSNGTQKFPHALAAGIAAEVFASNFLMKRLLMKNKQLSDHVLYPVTRVERTERILEDNLHVAAKTP